MNNLWAQSTWKRKRSVWKQYEDFHEKIEGRRPEDVHEDTAMLFVIQTKKRLGATSAKEYGADLLAIKEKLKPDLVSIQRNDRKESGGDGTRHDRNAAHQATPWLQWMTASRWSDVAGSRNDLKLIGIDKTEVAVLFGPTKTTRREAAREDHQVIVKRLPRLPGFFTTPLNGPMSTWSTTKMDTWLGAQGSPTEIERLGTTMTAYTTHAVKRGALHLLVTKAAEIPGFPAHLIPLLAKHKRKSETIPQVTMRYLSGDDDRVAVARTLRTQEATLLMNPL